MFEGNIYKQEFVEGNVANPAGSIKAMVDVFGRIEFGVNVQVSKACVFTTSELTSSDIRVMLTPCKIGLGYNPL